ncbi:MAG: hypothetical protein RL264_1366 [Bacteroidota bacterium]|jgi:tetratricopeptide (TPR) repeat protein/DNA-binding CsgD family transcriptional regulator
MNLNQVFLFVFFLLLPKISLSQNQTLLEKAFLSDKFFEYYFQPKNKITEISELLQKNKTLDSDLRYLELEFVKSIFPFNKPISFRIIKSNKLLLKIPEDKKLLKAILHYYIARDISYFSDRLALRHCELGLSILSTHKCKNLKVLFHLVQGGVNFKKGNFYNAVICYRKSLSLIPDKYLLKHSVRNNLGLCFKSLKKYNKAISVFNNTINKLKNSNINDDQKKYLIALIRANIGESQFGLGEFDDAEKNLEYYFSFVINHFEHREHAHKKLFFLYLIYRSKSNSKKDIQLIINYLNRVMYSKEYLHLQTSASEALIKIYEKERNLDELSKVIALNRSFREKEENTRTKEFNLIGTSLLDYTTQELKKGYEKQRQSSFFRTTVFFTGLLLTFILFLLLLWIRFRSKIHVYEINNLKAIQLEQEVLIKESAIRQLQLNLELKNSMNKLFNENIKSLRRKKSVTTEEILKELQLQLSNLIQIDKNSNGLNEAVDAEKMKFLETLKAKHPDLTRGELELCGYLRLELNSKEIANLMNNTDGTVRVNKTKLKAKLGIPKEKSIELYLKELMG